MVVWWKVKEYGNLVNVDLKKAWTLTNRNEQHLRIFERRILRKIFGRVQNEDGTWRIRMNYELMKKHRHIRFIKKQKNNLARSRNADG
jgi:hypothetical protein